MDTSTRESKTNFGYPNHPLHMRSPHSVLGFLKYFDCITSKKKIVIQKLHPSLVSKLLNIHGDIHAEKSLYLKVLEWIYVFHGYRQDTWISMCAFSMNGYFSMDIAWTLQPGNTV